MLQDKCKEVLQLYSSDHVAGDDAEQVAFFEWLLLLCNSLARQRELLFRCAATVHSSRMTVSISTPGKFARVHDIFEFLKASGTLHMCFAKGAVPRNNFNGNEPCGTVWSDYLRADA
jgi:hypothetical protein